MKIKSINTKMLDSVFFCEIDFEQSYYQIPMDPEPGILVKKTAVAPKQFDGCNIFKPSPDFSYFVESCISLFLLTPYILKKI